VRVFVAGGTGVIGRQLLPQLVEAGHQVTATTRRVERADLLRSLGATPAVLDALDGQAVAAAVRAARPDVVMNQLTELPASYDLRRWGPWYERTSRLRVEGTRHLLTGARAAGARRFVYQSIAFMYSLDGPPVLDEDAAIALDAPEPFGAAVRAAVEGERLALRAAPIQGVVLRYGALYGPGTHFALDGDVARQARRRRLPIVGRGTGMISFLHVEDAASAAVCALTRGGGVYNVVDDEPALAREWIPAFARAVQAPAPFRLPRLLVRMAAGDMVARRLVEGRGASNERARRELGWGPRHPSWRQGFLDAI
jgi:nucleoside-diphosphate-sugar epimerase